MNKPNRQAGRSNEWNRLAKLWHDQAYAKAPGMPMGVAYRDTPETAWGNIIGLGGKMEDVEKYLNDMTREVKSAKRELEKAVEDTKELIDDVLPFMAETVGRLRNARMAAIAEIRQSLIALGDVRKFFLEDQYTTEVERLERFTKLCRDLLEMKSSGALDALCDSAIRLMGIR